MGRNISLVFTGHQFARRSILAFLSMCWMIATPCWATSRTLIFFFNTDDANRIFETSPRRDRSETPRNETVNFAQIQFERVKRKALAAGDRFNSVIYYDPVGRAGLFADLDADPKASRVLVIGNGRILEEKSANESNSLRETLPGLVRIASRYFPNTQKSLLYFGHGLMDIYNGSGGGDFVLDRNVDEKVEQILNSPSLDSSEPDEWFDLEGLSSELRQAQGHSNRPLFESMMFFSCKMASIEVVTELRPFTRWILASELPVSHISWFGSFEFLDGIREDQSALEVLDLALKEQYQNSLVNSVSGEREGYSHRHVRWSIFETRWVSKLNESLKKLFRVIDDRFFTERTDLLKLFLRARQQGRWSPVFLRGVDLMQFLIELTHIDRPPIEAFEAIQVLEKMIHGPDRKPGQSGIWVMVDPIIREKYQSLAFDRITGWNDYVLRKLLGFRPEQQALLSNEALREPVWQDPAQVSAQRIFLGLTLERWKSLRGHYFSEKLADELEQETHHGLDGYVEAVVKRYPTLLNSELASYDERATFLYTAIEVTKVITQNESAEIKARAAEKLILTLYSSLSSEEWELRMRFDPSETRMVQDLVNSFRAYMAYRWAQD